VNERVLSRPLGRCVGLDVHLDFIEIAICEEGKVWSAGRVPSTPEGIKTLAESLVPSDRVALEVTGSSWEIVKLLEPHVRKVVVVSPGDTGIAQARAKTDRLDARTLARLLWTGELEAVWVPPEWISRMRRRLHRREQLVRARSRVKNELHAVLMRRLKGRPPVSDLFGVKGREWLRGLQLPLEEAETVQAGLRHIEFLDTEIEQVERLICQEALKSRQVRRLMTVPGVNVICAAVFLAAVGDIKRFKGSRPVVAYLGLDPRVYHSGSGPARGGRISKQGSPQARWALVEAARSVAQQPGPLHAFYERLRARKGHNSAVVAVARKLAVLFWCTLSRDSAGPWSTVARSDPLGKGGERRGRFLGAQGGRWAGRVRGGRRGWSAGGGAGRVPARSG
jgi:transposase